METPKEYKKLGVEVGAGKYHEELVYGIGLVYISMIIAIGEYLKEYDLSPTDMNILMLVKHKGTAEGLSQVDLGQRLMVTAHNMTRAIQRLEKQGWLTRVTHQKDARVNLVTVSLKGSKLLDKVWPGYDKLLQQLSNRLSLKEQKVLSALLQGWLNSKGE